MNKRLVRELFRAADAYTDSFLYLFKSHSEKEFQDKFSKWDSELFSSLCNALFQAITGDKRTFDEYYESFRAPASIEGKERPVAWLDGGDNKYETGEFGFIPDRVNDLLMDTRCRKNLTVEERVNRVLQLHKKTQRIEAQHKKGVKK